MPDKACSYGKPTWQAGKSTINMRKLQENLGKLQQIHIFMAFTAGKSLYKLLSIAIFDCHLGYPMGIQCSQFSNFFGEWNFPRTKDVGKFWWVQWVERWVKQHNWGCNVFFFRKSWCQRFERKSGISNRTPIGPTFFCRSSWCCNSPDQIRMNDATSMLV